jgi:Tfp pilus assembly pilus retraction ATPase PilT
MRQNHSWGGSRHEALRLPFMTQIQWDRLLATAAVRGASDILLSPGVEPMIRRSDSWQPLQTSPVEATALQAIVDAHLGPKPDGQAEQYAYWDFRFGDDAVRFRAYAFGYPATRLLLIARLPASGRGDAPDRCPECGAPTRR